MKASKVVRGYLQTKKTLLPLAGAPNKWLFSAEHLKTQHEADVESWRTQHPEIPAEGVKIEVGLLPLDPGKEADIMERAFAYAKKRGVERPKDGDELYDYGKALFRCLYGVVDIDSPPENPEPFFDEGVEQIEQMKELGREGVMRLAEEHLAYQGEITGHIQALDANSDEFLSFLEEASGPYGGALFFSFRPDLRVNSWVSMAVLLRGLLSTRSSSGGNAGKPSKRRRRSTRKPDAEES